MTRYADWPSRLETFLAVHRAEPFVYGHWDCFQFVRGAVAAMTGADLAAQFRPYSSRLGYLLQMRRWCGSLSLVRFAERLMTPFCLISVHFAQRGDVVLSDALAFGLVALNGRMIWQLNEAGDVVQLPLARAIRVWRI